MTTGPTVSVVMSVYNDAGRIERSVRSILDQTLHDLELIIVDDGSVDGTSERLDALASEDARIVVLHRENRGLTRSLIDACSVAQANLIARQDSDDWSHPARLADQVNLFRVDSRLVAVSCATQYVGPADEQLDIVARDSDPEAATFGLRERREGPPAHGSVMFRADAYRTVGGYREQFLYSQDSDLWLRLSEKGLFGYVPEVRYFHRKEAQSTSGARRAIQKQLAEISHRCREARDRGEEESSLLADAEAISRKERSQAPRHDLESATAELNYLLGSQLTRNRDARARQYLVRVLRTHPLSVRAWVRLLQSWLTGRAAG